MKSCPDRSQLLLCNCGNIIGWMFFSRPMIYIQYIQYIVLSLSPATPLQRWIIRAFKIFREGKIMWFPVDYRINCLNITCVLLVYNLTALRRPASVASVASVASCRNSDFLWCRSLTECSDHEITRWLRCSGIHIQVCSQWECSQRTAQWQELSVLQDFMQVGCRTRLIPNVWRRYWYSGKIPIW